MGRITIPPNGPSRHVGARGGSGGARSGSGGAGGRDPPRRQVIDLRSECGHFRILIIGRANAGKTTILKKVCNSIDDPEIFSPSGEKVTNSLHSNASSLLNRIGHDLLQLDPTTVQESLEVRLPISFKSTCA
jgi:hypothetical protein